ncbi:MAG TPA: beta-galactosidase [Candidatus Kryptonia bacterium]
MHRSSSIIAFAFILVSTLSFDGIPPSKKPIPVRFSRPDLVRYDRDGFTIGGKNVLIYSGSFHYFRCDTSDWIDRLEKIKAAGFNTIETYVAWNWHEREQGKADLSELDNFLTKCEGLGFYIIVRPGPYICAEWDVGGFPQWLAGKGIGFRGASSDDIKWSRYWYDEVLPVIRRHLISNGGGVIMMQIENEYDYYDLPDSEKVIYLKSLYESAVRNGIDVPIITCWTRQSRDKADSIFSQILDACNFYPAWNIEGTLPAIEKVKSDQPDAPPMINELQGGWFSSVGDSSVRVVDKYGSDQIDDLTKFVIGHGVKALNYYMLYGGTNFGYWGSKGRTTSYDYTAPISEPGGLWSKYRSVKLIGDFIRLGGEQLARAREVKGGCLCETKGVEALLRSDGYVSFLYVWNTTNKSVEAHVQVNAPRSSQFSLTIPMRGMDAYMLPVNYPLPGGTSLKYTNVQIEDISEFNGKPLVIAYGIPGDEAFISLEGSMNIVTVKNTDQLFNWEGVYFLLTSKERAARACELGGNRALGSLISDSYLAISHSQEGKTVSVDFQTRPGNDAFSLLAKSPVRGVTIDGTPTKTSSDPKSGMITFAINTPQMKMPSVPITDVRMSADPEFTSGVSEVKKAGDEFAPLESEGDFQSGYTIYSGTLTTGGDKLLKMTYYDDDWHSVFIDGRQIPGLTGNAEEDIAHVNIPLGTHKLTVVYENQGRPNGSFMEQNKGVKSITVLKDGERVYLNKWKYAPSAAPFPGSNPQEASLSFDDSNWEETLVGNAPQKFMAENEGRWFRTIIKMNDEELKQNPELLFYGVDDNAVVYVNGKLVVEHHGWDSRFSFTLSSCAKPGDNVVAVYVQNNGGQGGIYKPVRLEWGTPESVPMSLSFHRSLVGELDGWQSVQYDDSKWMSSPHWETVPSWNGILWYRGQFILPVERDLVIPRYLHIESTGDIQIWLNGMLLGRFFAEGPQQDFYLPPGWIRSDAKNFLVLVMRPSGAGQPAPVIKSVYVASYRDYAVRKHKMVIFLK